MRYLPYFLFLYLATNPFFSYAEQQKKIVLTSFPIIADMARNVAKDLIKVVSLVPIGADPHNYQAIPSDVIKIKNADLVLCNGLHLEEGFMNFFSSLRDNVKIVEISKGIKIIKNGESEPNPHAWMSVDNAIIYINNIRKALEELDPQNAKRYELNAQQYENTIKRTILPFKSKLDGLKEEDRWLVTSEECLVYLAEYLGFKSLYLWPINSHSEINPGQMRKVIDQMRKHKIKFIFSEGTNSDKPAKQVAYETNASYGGVLYVDTLTESDGPAPTYVDMLKLSFKTITDRLAI
ncbi:metal ABC transporter solute-binding protein, Zn/Mn family [Candidatus Liberibacter americanus]|uniref:ABC-type Mn/Zn transport system, periplasmic Mn/Zn-binding protein n=1 Tax=Candidatus Liberibacter americanus str. Sao Paulo TaxID=1261131 RepID=U6B5A2_9HYPH|nr:zinc ABC transporter substrate-binding protein [Candidatus Liberibacter americanus]AHA28229.1 ABC-type Mn/Zn transport system, periplasmic Mn/Zn-binding protein [Candidatus Liberibacter americanus str. Sao Paulo]EMS36257.1 periplasmic solute binding protein [Candidatus Liberibacter americanus PW_SP]